MHDSYTEKVMYIYHIFKKVTNVIYLKQSSVARQKEKTGVEWATTEEWMGFFHIQD